MKKLPRWPVYYYHPDGTRIDSNSIQWKIYNSYRDLKYSDSDMYNKLDEAFEYLYWDFVKVNKLVETLPDVKLNKLSGKHVWLNVYLIDRYCYSNAEGGCWGDYGIVETQYKVSKGRLKQELAYWNQWVTQENADRRSDISSVLSEGRYELEITARPGRNFPEVPYTYS